MSSEKSSKAESNIYGGRRLLFAVIVLLAGLAVILTACVIVMDEEIKTLRENVAEYQKWKGKVRCVFRDSFKEWRIYLLAVSFLLTFHS